ncbi:MAG: glycosyltransferase family 2 protein [Elusimicrobiota bacterium]
MVSIDIKDADSLALVAPVYNEAGVAAQALADWARALDALSIRHTIFAYNDGSRDDTLKELRTLEREVKTVKVIDKPNSGHGPTILRGYREASDFTWIMQIDSDGEMRPEDFAALWSERKDHDFLIARRVQRRQPLLRKWLTAFCILASRLLFGSGVDDVNCPYRLMRTARFQSAFAAIPDDTFAPNVLISGFAIRNALRIFQHPVRHEARVKSVSSFGANPAAVIGVAAKAFIQTLRYRLSA